MSAKIKNGFTLIELLVVISLIGILSTLVLANLNSARERSRDVQRKSDMRSMQTALRLYYNDVGSFPTVSALPAWGSEWKVGLTVYMNTLPKDPLSPTQDYVYTYIDSDNYTLRTCLENRSDNKCVTVADAICTSTCKYEVKP